MNISKAMEAKAEAMRKAAEAMEARKQEAMVKAAEALEAKAKAEAMQEARKQEAERIATEAAEAVKALYPWECYVQENGAITFAAGYYAHNTKEAVQTAKALVKASCWNGSRTAKEARATAKAAAKDVKQKRAEALEAERKATEARQKEVEAIAEAENAKAALQALAKVNPTEANQTLKALEAKAAEARKTAEALEATAAEAAKEAAKAKVAAKAAEAIRAAKEAAKIAESAEAIAEALEAESATYPAENATAAYLEARKARAEAIAKAEAADFDQVQAALTEWKEGNTEATEAAENATAEALEARKALESARKNENMSAENMQNAIAKSAKAAEARKTAEARKQESTESARKAEAAESARKEAKAAKAKVKSLEALEAENTKAAKEAAEAERKAAYLEAEVENARTAKTRAEAIAKAAEARRKLESKAAKEATAEALEALEALEAAEARKTEARKAAKEAKANAPKVLVYPSTGNENGIVYGSLYVARQVVKAATNDGYNETLKDVKRDLSRLSAAAAYGTEAYYKALHSVILSGGSVKVYEALHNTQDIVSEAAMILCDTSLPALEAYESAYEAVNRYVNGYKRASVRDVSFQPIIDNEGNISGFLSVLSAIKSGTYLVNTEAAEALEAAENGKSAESEKTLFSVMQDCFRKMDKTDYSIIRARARGESLSQIAKARHTYKADIQRRLERMRKVVYEAMQESGLLKVEKYVHIIMSGRRIESDCKRASNGGNIGSRAAYMRAYRAKKAAEAAKAD